MAEIISRKRQHHWRWPASANFFLGGTGVGFHALLYWGGRTFGNNGAMAGSLLHLIPPFCVAAGLMAVALEAGRPMKGVYLFANVRQSWMAREALSAALFIIISLVATAADAALLPFLASIAGVFFVVSQGMILFRSAAVPAWGRAVVPLFLASSGLLHGFSLWLMLGALGFIPVTSGVLVYGTACLGVTVSVWLWGLYAEEEEEAKRSLQPIRSKRHMAVGAGIGGVLPMLFLGMQAALAPIRGGSMAAMAYALCAVVILACGYIRIHRLICGVDYLRPVCIRNTGEGKNEKILQTR